jgi:V-type H+-transporting ATPase subunit H
MMQVPAFNDIPSNGIEENIIPRRTVLEKNLPWEGYYKAAIISEKELEYIRRYDKKPDEVKRGLIEKEGPAFAELFLTFVLKISNPETLQYVLTLIHDLLLADPKRVALFYQLADKGPGFPYQPFVRLVTRDEKDYYVIKTACGILGMLMSKAQRVPDEHLDFMLRWAIEQIRRPTSYDAHIAVTLLQALAQKDEYRVAFANAGGITLLTEILRTQQTNLQLLYETMFVVWLLTYNERIANDLVDTGLIKAIVDTIKVVTKEKVLRLAIAALRNLVDKSKNNEEMIDAGFVRMLAILQNKKWGDEDIVEDLKVISEALAKNIVVLSSFDMYKKELQSGQLEWSPVHKSEKFWRENCSRFEENDFQILQLLQRVLQTSIDPVALSVACFDVGEFVRFHPRGRSIVQQQNVKIEIMKLMAHQDPEVKKQALFAIQKTMVHNWEYLTK